MGKYRDIARDYASITQFHGLHELITIKQRWLLIVWILVLVGAFLEMLRELQSLRTDYRAEMLATYVGDFYAETFPTVMVCPMNAKYSLKKLAKITRYDGPGSNLTQPLLLHNQLDWLSYLTSFEVLTISKSLAAQYVIDEPSRAELKKRFWSEFMTPDRSYEDVELDLTIDFDQLITAAGDKMTNKRKLLTGLGACYAWEFDKRVPKMLAPFEKRSFLINRDEKIAVQDHRDKVYKEFFHQHGDYIHFGEPSFLLRNSPHSLRKGQWERYDEYGNETMNNYHDVYVASFPIHRENLRRKPCRKWTNDDRDKCIQRCFNTVFCNSKRRQVTAQPQILSTKQWHPKFKTKANSNVWYTSPFLARTPCLLYDPSLSPQELHGRMCSLLDGSPVILTRIATHCMAYEEMYYQRIFDPICDKECPQSCDEIVYYVTTGIDQRKTDSNHATVNIYFQRPYSQIRLEEKAKMDTQVYFGEIAGIVGLWWGAPLLAFIHVFFYWISRIKKPH